MKRFFLENLSLKIPSVVIAVLAWALVVGQQTIQETVEVSLAVNVPSQQGLVIANDVPPFIKVTVKGARVKLRGLKRGLYRISMDLSDAEPGKRIVSIPIHNLEFPTGVEVQRVSPSAIDVLIDTVAERWLSIEPKIDGFPEEGFFVSGTAVEPKQIKVTGPRTLLRDRKNILTKPIPVSHRTGNFSVETAVELPSSKFSSDQIVRVDVRIDESMEIQEFRGIPVRVVGDVKIGGHKITVYPEVVNVKIKGSVSDLRELKSSMIHASVRADNVPTEGGRIRAKPQIRLPAETELQSIDPSLVFVVVQ